MRNSETSLTGVLTRSKTHGPDKRIKRKPVFLDKSCWCAVKNWCDVGFNLLQELAPNERDYLLPSPGPNYGGIREAEKSHDAGLATTSSLHRGLVAEGQQLLDPALCVYWTPHSPRSFMATCCAALGVAKAERNVLGRWTQNQSDTYVRLQRTLVQKLQLLVVSVLRGRDDIGSVLGEGESLQELESFLEKRGVSRDAIKKQLMKLDKAALPGHAPPQDTESQPLQVQVEALEEEMVQLDPVPEDELDVVVRRQPGRQACANQGISSTSAEGASRRVLCLRSWPFQGETIAQVGVLLDGPWGGLLCVLVQRPAHAAGSRVRRSVQALQHGLVHASATRQWLRHGSVHGH